MKIISFHSASTFSDHGVSIYSHFISISKLFLQQFTKGWENTHVLIFFLPCFICLWFCFDTFIVSFKRSKRMASQSNSLSGSLSYRRSKSQQEPCEACVVACGKTILKLRWHRLSLSISRFNEILIIVSYHFVMGNAYKLTHPQSLTYMLVTKGEKVSQWNIPFMCTILKEYHWPFQVIEIIKMNYQFAHLLSTFLHSPV